MQSSHKSEWISELLSSAKHNSNIFLGSHKLMDTVLTLPDQEEGGYYQISDQKGVGGSASL